jgi:hypothetical protein
MLFSVEVSSGFKGHSEENFSGKCVYREKKIVRKIGPKIVPETAGSAAVPVVDDVVVEEPDPAVPDAQFAEGAQDVVGILFGVPGGQCYGLIARLS